MNVAWNVAFFLAYPLSKYDQITIGYAQKLDLDWQSEQIYSLKLENLQTGSDFEQPALTPPDYKSGKKSGQRVFARK